jgi:predicted MFS family arabinose efflux permease
MPETEARLRRNFTWDAMGALGTGLFTALVVNFLAVIARREGADPMLLAGLAAGPFAANTLAIFSGFLVPSDGRRVQFVSLLLIVGRALFFLGLLTTGPLALLFMGLGMWLTMALVAPQQVDVWRGAYPQRLRARVLGYLRVLQTLATAVGAPLGGLLIDRLGQGALLSVGAGLGIVGAAGYSGVRSQPVAASQRFTPAASLRILAEQPRYRRLVLAWVVWGFGSFMATPLYALVLVDRFQASYADVGLLQLVGALSGLLAYFVLGQYLDRRGGFGATPIGLLLVSLVPLVYVWAPSLGFLALGYILLNVGNSASDLGWQVALVSRVDDAHRLRYQAAHTSLTGLRGVAAPFAGSLALALGLGIAPVLIVGASLALIGASMMAVALGVPVPGANAIRSVLVTARAIPATRAVRAIVAAVPGPGVTRAVIGNVRASDLGRTVLTDASTLHVRRGAVDRVRGTGFVRVVLGDVAGSGVVRGIVRDAPGTGLRRAVVGAIRGSRVVRAVVGDASRPRRYIRRGHRIVGPQSRIEKSPLLDVNEVLLPRQQRPATHALAGSRRGDGRREAAHELMHDPAWYPLALGRVDVAEEDEVREQYAPVPGEAAH